MIGIIIYSRMFRERGTYFNREAEGASQNYYEVLGVDPGASGEEIQSAYRRIAKESHPDLNPNDKQAVERFRRATEAYEVLRDVQKRQQYDRQYGQKRPAERQQSRYAGMNSEFEEIFRRGDATVAEILRQMGIKDPFSAEELRRAAEGLERQKREIEKKKRDLEEKLRRRQSGGSAPAQDRETQSSRPAERHGSTQYTTGDRGENNSSRTGGAHSENMRTTSSGARIQKGALYEYLVDSDGNHISNGYERIEERNGFLLGKSASFERLLDAHTGRELSSLYRHIEVRGKLLIGKSESFERLLDPQTGKEISDMYQSIIERDGHLIGRSSSFERLLDPRTGEVLSSMYNSIFVRDGLLIGKSSSFEYLLDSTTGQEVSHGFKKIERRGSHIIGNTGFREEVIR